MEASEPACDNEGMRIIVGAACDNEGMHIIVGAACDNEGMHGVSSSATRSAMGVVAPPWSSRHDHDLPPRLKCPCFSCIINASPDCLYLIGKSTPTNPQCKEHFFCTKHCLSEGCSHAVAKKRPRSQLQGTL